MRRPVLKKRNMKRLEIEETSRAGGFRAKKGEVSSDQNPNAAVIQISEAPPRLSIPPEPKPIPETLSPYIKEVEINCDECGGSGFDPGGIDPWGPEVCPKCRGAKTQTIIRNYLAEAFQIAANPDSTRQIERRHLIAVIQHCREVVSALVSLPEVA